jgi:hypothetical protein
MRRAPIRCTACGWTKVVAVSKAAQEIAYHRDVTCTSRTKPEPPAPGRFPSRRAQAAARAIVARSPYRMTAQDYADMD